MSTSFVIRSVVTPAAVAVSLLLGTPAAFSEDAAQTRSSSARWVYWQTSCDDPYPESPAWFYNGHTTRALPSLERIHGYFTHPIRIVGHSDSGNWGPVLMVNTKTGRRSRLRTPGNKIVLASWGTLRGGVTAVLSGDSTWRPHHDPTQNPRYVVTWNKRGKVSKKINVSRKRGLRILRKPHNDISQMRSDGFAGGASLRGVGIVDEGDSTVLRLDGEALFSDDRYCGINNYTTISALPGPS